MARLELCHVFLFVEPEAIQAAGVLRGIGLRESCRREHPGQGTANLCYCFDNAFLELLWVTDKAALTSPVIARTGLAARADWHSKRTNPFGIALRPEPAPPFPTWNYTPPYLPEDRAIPVALSSEDPTQPLLFVSPGNTRPDQWMDGRAGARQVEAGLSEIIGLELSLDADIQPCADLQALSDTGFIKVIPKKGRSQASLVLSISQSNKGPARRLELPAMKWLEPSR
ncbi:VOC family protein [Pelagibius sp. Alg239-R121]|uniref:VOC family protein n=1 Tax=Pelagibius sp. Alg239-R121 TaxID=2993448 RepID=UPI0024A766B3|nr:VOC family protein [Pelagibius sp. Alg239-R121]